MIIRKFIDLIVTLCLWIYFIFGFLILFLPRYLVSYPGAEGRELRYQLLHHQFFNGFFMMVQGLIPSLSIEIDLAVRDIRSSIIVCNHISYLDPLLLVSSYEKQKTIVKHGFFRAPVFGWMMIQSGYVSASGKGVSPWQMAERMLRLGDYLATGGNVFVFPEGTRSRTGEIGELHKGAFEIAIRSRAPIKVLFVENSNRLFTPGKFLFNTAIDQPIRLRLVEELDPDYDNPELTIEGLMETVKNLLESENRKC